MQNRYEYTKLIEGLFWKTAKAHRVSNFNEAMWRIYVVNHETATYLNNIDFKSWAYAYFIDVCYNIITINIVKLFNVFTRHARKLPVTMFIEFIRATL